MKLTNCRLAKNLFFINCVKNRGRHFFFFCKKFEFVHLTAEADFFHRSSIPGNTKWRERLGTIDLLFDWFGLVCFANKNKKCLLSYSWFQTSQTGGQWYSDTSPFSIPCSIPGNAKWRERLSTVDLLIRVPYFFEKGKQYFQSGDLNYLVQGG